jgi:hypothetical protein
MTAAARLLDRVQSVEQLAAFDPATFLAAARADLAAPVADVEALGAALDDLRALLGEIDRFTQKNMNIRLVAALDLPRQLRGLLHTTIIAYEHQLPLLRQRLGAALGAHLDLVVAMAESVLATRATLRQGIAGLLPEVAAAWQPVAQRAIRDRSQRDEVRARWKRAAVDLGQLAVATLESGSFAERLERIPVPDDPPDSDDERPHRFELIEID